ncbi:RanGTP-binding protein [Colletotrichum tamarilloi]|uniref:RanGTP-binding protein n=1 Tax=Colletotrichum tamarilloi TaxID=1209934 RepID=A0ABQ9QNI9_9PEZI|nr:RanGTP-binding protein [Colletotrichum tamarilloi]KAK1479380.1 RanGTP-binding protein [Colletotrichum tamarilloi]
MDALLAKLGAQAMNMAIRSGIALTSTYAFSQCSRLMKTVDDRTVRSDIKKLQKRLDSKIKARFHLLIVSPAIDLIEFKSGRGNAFLESALPLAKSLRRDIVALGRRVEQAAQAGEASRGSSRQSIDSERQFEELKAIIKDMKDLLAQLDNDIPLLHMAISASGESLNSAMSPHISPSRFSQAGTFLTYGDSQFAVDPTHPAQIGPIFTLSIYMLFLGHSSKSAKGSKHAANPQTPQKSSFGESAQPYGIGEGDRKPLWQEVMHKARVRLCRTPMDHVFDSEEGFRPKAPKDQDSDESRFYGSNPFGFGPRNEYAYHLEIIEDLDDGRAHDDLEADDTPYDDIVRAGIRESIPIYQISRIFYADTGRILNIGSDDGDNNPVLLLKRDVLAKPPLKTQEEMMSFQDEPDSPTAFMAGSESEDIDEQDDVDRQLREESAALDTPQELPEPPVSHPRRSFPSHLDPEWIALEVFEEDESDSSDTEDEDVVEQLPSLPRLATPTSARGSPRPALRNSRTSLDSRLMAQIQNLSVQSSPFSRSVRSPTPTQPFSQEVAKHSLNSSDSFAARSPFNAVVTSLSLMEMLIRLTSLQEFQQAPHLTMHDHILNFFLEESSTTGLTGEERLRARTETKKRVGFDPYTDTPSRQ